MKRCPPVGYEESPPPPSCGENEPISACLLEAAESVPDDSQRLSQDPTLTAFAQLGAFRLNCQRSFISLMDHKNQYILAEATKSASLTSQGVCDQGDEMYLGPRVLDMVWGVCPNTIQVFTAKDGSCNISTAEVLANPSSYVMNDMSAIDQFKDRPYIAGWPYMRFYAEVPIHSPTGYVIGTFCVVDNKPREGLDQKGLDALNEISSAIMQHLELVQMQHNLQRTGGMVKGLGEFVEGKGRMLRSSREQANDSKNISDEPSTSWGSTSKSDASPLERRASSSVSSEPTSISTTSGPALNRTAEASTKREPKLPVPTVPTKTKGSPGGRELVLSELVSFGEEGSRQLFSRASYLIREAIDLDGLIFVDANFRDVAIDPANPILLSTSSTSSRYKGTPDTPLGDRSDWLDTVGRTTGVVSSDTFPSPRLSPARPDRDGRSLSNVLGSCIRSLSDIGVCPSSATQVPLPQSTLRGLLQKYRQGQTFVYDDDGEFAHTEDALYQYSMEELISSASTSGHDDHDADKLLARQLLDVCADAKSIIFFPLWDPQRNQWFAGGLAWTKDPSRIIDSTDTTYLTAFGSCIMSEQARLDAVSADRAKSDFISSVSHELRSPLHGILASAEALQETVTDSMQEDTIRTVVSCGELLLDTVDQM